MLTIDGDKVKFSSGRIAYANGGVVGISPTQGISQGWDGSFHAHRDSAADTELTDDDMRELADYMIALWAKFKENIGTVSGRQ